MNGLKRGLQKDITIAIRNSLNRQKPISETGPNASSIGVDIRSGA